MAQELNEREDTLSYYLKEIEVGEKLTQVKALNKGRILWNLEKINELPQILGQADPIRYTQTLPGVQTNNEYDSGLHIYGCDNTHNLIGIDGVPLYNVNHLLGFFSIFNTSHFPSFTINKSAFNAEFPNRLGGLISMDLPKEIPDSINGDFSLGMISSQATIQIPIGKRNMISVSARTCYVNLLYGNALKIDNSQFKYSFGDINATWLYKHDKKNTFTLSFFRGQDDAEMNEYNYLANMNLKWNNLMFSAKWEHMLQNTTKTNHSIYYTGYNNNFRLNQETINVNLPSSISDIAYLGKFQKRDFIIGVNAILHRISPQAPEISGAYNTHNKPEKYNTQEYSLHLDKLFSLPNDIAINTGLRSSLYIDDNNNTHFAIDPSFSLSMNKSKWNFSTTLSTRHQYIYQTGFSSMGFPTEFWMTCNNKYKPQKGTNLVSTFTYRFTPELHLSTEIYYKFLQNLIEYNSNILDFIQTEYTLDNYLFQGSGRNFGINLMLSFSAKKASGWLSYNIGRALRKFNDRGLNGVFPANHERISELNIVGKYDINKYWSLGTTYVFATGTPFTAPEYFYIMAGHLMTQYGEHNACRLSPYSRLDISINYKFKTAYFKESGLNLSIYNVLFKSNELFWRWKITDGKEFEYSPTSFTFKIIPSLSYYIKF